MQNATQNPHTSNAMRRLVRKHYFQIITEPQHPELRNLFAVTFQPSDRSGTFGSNPIRRVGTTVMVVLSYEAPSPAKPDRLTMPLRGFRAAANPDGSVCYGGQTGCSFQCNGALLPRRRTAGQAINYLRNPGLVELLLRLDGACKRRVSSGHYLAHVPQLPRILLGFASNEPPRFEDSAALRRLACQRLGVPIDRLGVSGDVVLDRFLRDLWQEQLIEPTSPANPTGHLLVDAEFCTQARRSLEIFEDFSNLLGKPCWNPVREVPLLQVPNPARDVLRQYNVDTGQDFNQPISETLLRSLEEAMRAAIGPTHRHFTQEEIFDGLVALDRPLVGYTACLPRLRAQLAAHVSMCATDEDLLRAARNPNGPLVATGACKTQVVGKRHSATGDPFHFGPAALNRRIQADLSNGVGKADSNGRRRSLVAR